MSAEDGMAENTGLLLQVGPQGIEAFAQSIPALWVTAPTRDGAVTGYAVNGAFAVDVGRAQLGADSEESRLEAERIGRSLGQSFLELYDVLSGENRVVALVQIGLPPDFDTSVLWRSLWNLLSRPVNGSQTANELLHSMLWVQDRGYIRLLEQRLTLPTGLPSVYSVLTNLGKIRFQVVGIADEQETFNRIAAWTGVRNAYPPGTLLSQERIGRVLSEQSSGGAALKTSPLSLKGIMESILVGADVSPERATQFGELINLDFTREAAKRNAEEVRELWAYLSALRFISEDGSALTANDVLLTAEAIQPQRDRADAEEEVRRAAFAPARYRTARTYLKSEAAVAFLRACRREGQRRIDRAEEMATWGRIATDTVRRVAFLEYLANGEFSTQIAKILLNGSDGMAGTWLEDFPSSEAYQTLNAGQRAAVSLKLRPIESAAAILRSSDGNAGSNAENGADVDDDDHEDFVFQVPPAALPQLSRYQAHESVRRISDIWSRDGAKLHRAYDEKTYPDGGAFFDQLTQDPPLSARAREAWLLLLLRGSLESMGRANAGQHRNFLSLCEQNHWLFTLAEYGQSDAGNILRDFEKWLVESIEDVEYFHWVRYFLPIAFTVRHVEDYAHAFLSLNETGDKFQMLWVNAPSLSPARVIVPPLRPLLGVGTHFVLRELVRKGIVKNSAAYPYCYVPGKSVLDKARALGAVFDDNREAQSRTIYTTLTGLGADDPTFNHAFDIALRDD